MSRTFSLSRIFYDCYFSMPSKFITYLYLSIIVLIYKWAYWLLKFTLLFDAFITSFGVFYRPYFTCSYHCCWNVWNKFYTIQIKLSTTFYGLCIAFFSFFELRYCKRPIFIRVVGKWLTERLNSQDANSIIVSPQTRYLVWWSSRHYVRFFTVNVPINGWNIYYLRRL
jgi:hypothetical protein